MFFPWRRRALERRPAPSARRGGVGEGDSIPDGMHESGIVRDGFLLLPLPEQAFHETRSLRLARREGKEVQLPRARRKLPEVVRGNVFPVLVGGEPE